jgi:hypothetical protein
MKTARAAARQMQAMEQASQQVDQILARIAELESKIDKLVALLETPAKQPARK